MTLDEQIAEPNETGMTEERLQTPAIPQASEVPVLPYRLSAAQARVLGALVEKEITTPEYYPLTLNALINACNQRSNREPVMDLDEDEVRQALHRLEDYRLAGGWPSRV